MKTILFIDGENFKKKISEIFGNEGQETPDFSTYDFRGLLDKVLNGISRDREIFYFARLKEHPSTKEKSRKLIEAQRMLKTSLEKQGFNVIMAGRVRGQWETRNTENKLIFREKGVDVKIAVDMVTYACEGELGTAILGSSDSDLQPAVKELSKRKISETIYLGFEFNPNKGLIYTTRRTILIRNSEILEFAVQKLI